MTLSSLPVSHPRETSAPGHISTTGGHSARRRSVRARAPVQRAFPSFVSLAFGFRAAFRERLMHPCAAGPHSAGIGSGPPCSGARDQGRRFDQQASWAAFLRLPCGVRREPTGLRWSKTPARRARRTGQRPLVKPREAQSLHF